MKLNNYFVAILTAFALSACSDDIGEEHGGNQVPEIVYDATLSMAVEGGKVQTKASSADVAKLDLAYGITRLSMAVFQNDQLVAFGDTANSNGIYQVDEVKVPSGVAKVLLLANVVVEKGKQKQGTPLSDYMGMINTLANEKNNELSMSSGVLNFSLRAGHNYVGYASAEKDTTIDHGGVLVPGRELTGEKIGMVRNIARVLISTIYLKPSANYRGTDKVSFKVKEFFVANVKNESKIVPDAEGKVEINGSGKDFWLAGNFAEQTGALKTGEVTEVSWLRYDVTAPPISYDPEDQYAALKTAYPFLNGENTFVCNGNIFGLDEQNKTVREIKVIYDPKEEETYAKPDHQYPHIEGSYGAGFPLGTYFYVYENKAYENDRTLFIVKGDYTYTPIAGKAAETLKDRYYAVIVNDSSDNTGADHNYIKRNYVYDIVLTVAGPGSETPFDRQATAHVSAQVKVKDWNVIEQDEKVD